MEDEVEVSATISAEQIAGSAIVVPPAVTISDSAGMAMAELEAWRLKHVANSAFSRDTRAYNRIHAALVEIGSAIASVKE